MKLDVFFKNQSKLLTIDIITKHFPESQMQVWAHGIYLKVDLHWGGPSETNYHYRVFQMQG